MNFWTNDDYKLIENVLKFSIFLKIIECYKLANQAILILLFFKFWIQFDGFFFLVEEICFNIQIVGGLNMLKLSDFFFSTPSTQPEINVFLRMVLMVWSLDQLVILGFLYRIESNWFSFLFVKWVICIRYSLSQKKILLMKAWCCLFQEH